MKSTIDLLTVLNSKIQHLITPTLRAESLVSLLNIEKENYSKVDLQEATKQGTIEMLDAMNKHEIKSDFDFCIYFLRHFIETGNFDVLFAERPKSHTEKEKLQELKEKIESIVNLN